MAVVSIDNKRAVDQAALDNSLRSAGLGWRMSWVGDIPETYTLEIYRRSDGEVLDTADVRNGDGNVFSEFVDMVARCTQRT